MGWVKLNEAASCLNSTWTAIIVGLRVKYTLYATGLNILIPSNQTQQTWRGCEASKSQSVLLLVVSETLHLCNGTNNSAWRTRV